MSKGRLSFLPTLIPGLALMLSPAVTVPVAAQDAICWWWDDPDAFCNYGQSANGTCDWCYDSQGGEYGGDCDDGEGTGWYGWGFICMPE
jgi:hypothetical protein